MTIRSLKSLKLQSLAKGILREKPGLTSKELYSQLCQTPAVVAFRQQRFPDYNKLSSHEGKAALDLAGESKTSKQTASGKDGAASATQTTSVAAIAPTRTCGVLICFQRVCR